MSVVSRILQCWLIFLVALGAPAMAQDSIDGQLSFSTDGGQTFSTTAPTVAGPQVIEVRAEWRGVKDARAIESDIITTTLWSEERDFASANRGKQTTVGKTLWAQRIPQYYAHARRDSMRVYPLDLRARLTGDTGSQNVWDAAAGKFVDGPLPGVPARSAGIHRFVFKIAYFILDDNGKRLAEVERDFPFAVTIDPRKATTNNSHPAATSQAVQQIEPQTPPQPLPVLHGVKVYDASQWKPISGAESLATNSPLVRPASEQEIELRTDVAGEFLLRVLVETGAVHGEEELSQESPWLYLNGRPLVFVRSTPPIAWNGTHVAIIETADKVRLALGDQLRWNSAHRSAKWVGGVALASQKLALAPTDVTQFYDPDLHDAFRLSGTFGKAANGNVTFQIEARNVAGHASRLNASVEVRDFWQNVAAAEKFTLNLKDRAQAKRRYEWTPRDTDRYRAIVRVRADNGLEREQVFDLLQDNPLGARPRLWLNTDWEWTSLPDDGTSKTRVIGSLERARGLSGWKRVELPATWVDTEPSHHIAWYRRRFEAPTWRSGKRLKLHFSRISFEGQVYLNGRRVGEHYGPSGPFEFDITDAVQPGSNDLWLGVRGGIAALEDAELASPNISITPRRRFRAPEPLRAGVGEIWIDGVGTPAIEDVFVQTSFRNRHLKLQVTLPQVSGGTLTNRVLYQGREVLRLPDVPLFANVTSPVEVSQGWNKPILWNRGDPRLLQLVTEIKDVNGRQLDRLDTRFGFREFWAEGRQLMWNGTPMKFTGVPFLYHWSWNMTQRSKRPATRAMLLLAKRMGGNFQRHVYDPEAHAEMNDEEGLVMVQAMGGVVHPTGQKMASDEHWRNAEKFTQEMIRGMRNHPSIVTWYLSNEFSAYETENLARLRALGEAALKVDRTRIIEFGCDLDLNGFAPIISTHYPVDYRALAEERTFFPEAFYWRRFDTQFNVGQKVPAGLERRVANVRDASPITWGAKPIVVNETLWNFFFLPPDGLSRLVGEEVYRSPVAVDNAFNVANYGFIQGHRDAEASVITPWWWAQRDPMRNLVPVEINPLQRYAHFFAGQKVHFDVNLHHDRPHTSSMEWIWSVDGAQPGTPRKQTLKLAPAELNRQRIEITLPITTIPQQLTLHMRLVEGGKTVRQQNLPLSVYPRQVVKLPSGVRFGLFDPAGTTLKALAGVAGLQTVAQLNGDALRDVQVLIIGDNAYTSIDETARAPLNTFIRGGGRVLVLAQKQSPTFLPFSLATTLLAADRAWSFRENHRALQGLKANDFSNWFPAGRLGSNFYLKPEAGDYRTILDAGGPNGLVYSGLIERPWGDGLVVCSQLDLISGLQQNPIAQRLLNNLFAYVAPPATPRARVGFWGDAEGALSRAVQPLAARFQPFQTAADLANLDAVLIDGQKELLPVLLEELRAFATRGGKIWVHGVTPANKSTFENLIGAPIQLRAPGPPAWKGRAVKTNTSPNLAGVTHFDLFWKKRTDSEQPERTFYDEQSTLAPLGDWAIESAGVQPLLYPQLVVETAVGRGTVVLDNLNWQNGDYVVRSQARRLASTLLANLGVTLEEGRSVEVPTGLRYQTVDLTPVVNRTFADEVADDGKGGWTDQGPEADLSAFPTASHQTFHGVPFQISSRGAVVLSSPKRSAGPPQSVQLLVQGKADALFFLQTSAWTNKRHHASYVVHYEDGTKHEIQLIGDVNLRDWVTASPADPFPFETETRTRAAWTGPIKTFASATLFLMAWPNPHPERAIRSVSFESKNEGVPVLVGVTIGVKNSGSQPTASAQISGRALLAQAYEHEQKRDWQNAITTLQTLLQIEPENLEALFRLGQNYEELKMWPEAEQTYQRSLAIDRNQPHLLRAIENLNQREK